jgi:hypothetical protein
MTLRARLDAVGQTVGGDLVQAGLDLLGPSAAGRRPHAVERGHGHLGQDRRHGAGTFDPAELGRAGEQPQAVDEGLGDGVGWRGDEIHHGR